MSENRPEKSVESKKRRERKRKKEREKDKINFLNQ